MDTRPKKLAAALLFLLVAGLTGLLWNPPRESSAEERPGPRAAAAASALLVSRPESLAPYRAGLPGHVSGTVVDPSGTPLAGAACTLAPGGPTWGFGAARGGKAALTERSDADGGFEFALPEQLAGELWSLEVAAEGFAPWRLDHLLAGDRLDVGLTPEVALEVVVHDAGGRPVSGARVELLQDFRLLDGPVLAAGATDASGRVTLSGVGAGDGYLSLADPRYRYLVETVEVGSSAPLAFELAARPGARVRGRVARAPGTGPPVAPRVLVEAYSRGQSVLLDLACDERGEYATAALFAPGEMIRVSARDAGLGEVQAWAMIPMLETPEGLVVDLELAAPERVARGRATDDGGRGLVGIEVRSASIPPVGRGPDALVSALMQVPHYTERWRQETVTGADGEFELRGLAADQQYVLAFSDPARSLAPAFTWVPLTAPGDEIRLGDVALEASGGLWGVLRDERGAPVAGAPVSVDRELIVPGGALDTWRPTRWWRPIQTTTRADGFFRFESLAPGSYDLKWKGEPLTSQVVIAGQLSGPLELFVVGAAPLVEGRVAGAVLGPSGEPVSGAFVALFRPDAVDGDRPVAMTMTDLGGEYELRAPPERPYTLRVSDLQGQLVEHEEALENLPPDLERTVRLASEPAPAEPLVVLVLGPDGMPLEGIDVLLEPPENAFCGCISFRSRSDDLGFVTIERIAAKGHRVIISDPFGRYPAEVHDSIWPGMVLEVVLGG